MIRLVALIGPHCRWRAGRYKLKLVIDAEQRMRHEQQPGNNRSVSAIRKAVGFKSDVSLTRRIREIRRV